jgi:hypothetical protein
MAIPADAVTLENRIISALADVQTLRGDIAPQAAGFNLLETIDTKLKLCLSEAKELVGVTGGNP